MALVSAPIPTPSPSPSPTALKQARYSNYNFCNRKRGFDANVKEAHGALMSFVVRGELNQSSWELAVDEAAAIAPGFSAVGAVTTAGEAAAGGGGLRLWREVNAAFPVSLDDMVSGPEDPRVLRLDDGATLVLVAAWEATKVQWQHALEISEAEVPEGGGGGGGGGGAPVATRLEVDLRYAQLLALGLKIGLLPPPPHIHTRALSRPLTALPIPSPQVRTAAPRVAGTVPADERAAQP